MEDIDNAKVTARTASGIVGMTRAELERANDLLKDYGEKRENLLKAMVLLLGQSDISNLDRDWRDCCINGRDALARLNAPRSGTAHGTLAPAALGVYKPRRPGVAVNPIGAGLSPHALLVNRS